MTKGKEGFSMPEEYFASNNLCRIFIMEDAVDLSS